MPDFQVSTMVKARKQHTCCECGGSIEPEQQYRLVSGSWDGCMDSYKQCLPCVDARNWALDQPEWADDGEHAYYFGQLISELHDLAPEIQFGDGRRIKAYRLIIAAQQRGRAS